MQTLDAPSMNEIRAAGKLAGNRLRVAVVGCGAIARDFHLPVLAGHEGVRITALIDRDVKAAAGLAHDYGVDGVASDFTELRSGAIDAALIATPPYHHAPAAIDLIRRGIHVFVEKPMAVTTAEAEEMTRAAEQAGVTLAVGVFRRLYPSSRMMRALLEAGVSGRPIAFDVEEGHVMDWPSVTLGSMRKELAGGGVLIDTGSHVLDQLLSFFSGPAELLDYEDNALGGIEADCRLRLRIYHHGLPVEGSIRLSRLCKLRNTFRIECERAVLELPVDERYRVVTRNQSSELVDPATGAVGSYQLQAGWSTATQEPIHEAFRAEIEDWLEAIQSSRQPFLSGRSVLPTVRLIEECYRQARPLPEPWVQESSGAAGAQRTAFLGNGKRPRRVLVTGATGFIGCRVVELLHLREGWQVRALVHRPGRCGRLARLPVEMVIGDLASRNGLEKAADGCDAVIHCAYGTAWGDRRAIFAATVQGTRDLAEAALAAGVRRFIHLSTAAVHGTAVTGDLDEASPIAPGRDDYAESKGRAEQEIARAARRGLSTVVLRLGNVYGPFSGPYTIRPVQHLRQGIPVLLGDGLNPSNTVYVDNVVEAILRSLAAPDDLVNGQTFTIGDDDGLSWRAYHLHYAEALGLQMRSVPVEVFVELRGKRRGGPIASVLAWPRAAKEIATSKESLALVIKMLQTEPLGRVLGGLLKSVPGVKGCLRRLLHLDRPPMYRREPAAEPPLPPLELLEQYSCTAQIRVNKACRILGYVPPVTRDRAMALTLAWLKQARL
jgi:predicted dehydrogenase/nucleoside-diphosphate-sugar epimerase